MQRPREGDGVERPAGERRPARALDGRTPLLRSRNGSLIRIEAQDGVSQIAQRQRDLAIAAADCRAAGDN